MKQPEQKKKTYRISATTYKHFSRLRIIGFVEIGFFAIIIITTMIFTYITVYKTLGSINVNDITSKGFGVEVIDFHRLESVTNAWNTKHATSTPSIPFDPFYPNAIPAPASTGSTTPPPATPSPTQSIRVGT